VLRNSHESEPSISGFLFNYFILSASPHFHKGLLSQTNTEKKKSNYTKLKKRRLDQEDVEVNKKQ